MGNRSSYDAVEQRRIVDALKESEERFRTVLETMDLIAVTLDGNGEICFCNDFFLQLTGWKREEIGGRGWFETFIPEEIREDLEQSVFLETIRSGKFPVHYQNEILVKDGSHRLIRWNNTIFRDADGEVSAITSIGEDITDRTKAEEALRKSEERFSSMFEHVSSGVAVYETIDNGKDFIFLAFNNAAEKITNISRDRVIGNSLLDIFPNMERSELIRSLQRVHQTGVEEVLPPFYYKDKVREGWRENRIYKLPTGEVVALFDDVTDRIEAEKALKQSERKHRSMMGAMKDSVYIVSSESRIEYMNPRMISRLGRDASGEICYEAIYKRNDRCPWCVFDQILQGQHVEYELENPVDDRHYFVTNSPIWQSEESVSKLTICRDITNEKVIEKQLRQARKMESIGTLSGGIAHDFNNILYIIAGNTDLAMEDIPEWNPVRENLEEIRSAASRGAGIVKQLLSFSRKDEQEMESVSMCRVVKDYITLLRTTIPASIEIQQNIPDDELTILGDPVQIKQILMNICLNACQVMEDAGGLLMIDVVEETTASVSSLSDRRSFGDYLKIAIRDTGPGIAPENVDRIFDPYFTTKEVGAGSGMGLAIAHALVENHNGVITVESQVGEGTAFNIFFPLFTESSRGEINCRESESNYHGTEQILFIDDEAPIVGMVGTMLKRLDYNVQTKTDPVQALALFQATPDIFDLIITDMTMPQMSGTELTEKIKAIRPDIPVIICTGHSALINTEKAEQLGVDSLVMKPIARIDLVKTIRRLLDGQRDV